MFGTLPGNPQRAAAISAQLDAEVFAAPDGSSYLCAVLDENGVDDFLRQAVECLSEFEVVERHPMEDSGKLFVRFACKDALDMLV